MKGEAAAKDFYEYLTYRIKATIKTYLEHEQIAFDIEQLPIDHRFSAQASLATTRCRYDMGEAKAQTRSPTFTHCGGPQNYSQRYAYLAIQRSPLQNLAFEFRLNRAGSR